MSLAGSYSKLSAANLSRTERYIRLIEKLMSNATGRLISLSASVDYDNSLGEQFYFSDYPELNKTVDKLVSNLAQGMETAIVTGTSAEWAKGTEDANGILEYVLKRVGLKSTEDLSEKVMGQYLNNHDSALKAFQRRQIGGISLSSKVWDLANQSKIEAELARSIAEGTSAEKLAESMKELLKRPNDLYRRVRDEFGTLHLSKRAKAYTPEVGAYRSSYKNALRLARTEINMSYRNAEQESYQDKDYVVGIEIRRSQIEYDCPLCESLAGKYPKNFKWNGWHPNCRCYMVPILITDEEMEARSDAIINGEDFDATKSKNYTGDVPDNFKEWVRDNSERIEGAAERGTLPYFIKDNEGYVEKYLIPQAETEIDRALRLSKESYRVIDDESEIRKLASTQQITSEEKDSIYESNWGRDGYVGTSNSWYINSDLRDGNTLSATDQKTVDSLDRVIAKNKAAENIMLFRVQGRPAAEFFFGTGLSDEICDKMDYFDFSKLSGKIMQDKGFSSASLTTTRNVFLGDSDRPWVMEIKVPKGSNVFITTNYRESECVLGRGQRIFVTGGRVDFLKDEVGDIYKKAVIECILLP